MSTIDQQRALLNAAIEERGISKAQLARLVGLSEKHVLNVLNGKSRSPQIDFMAFMLDLRFEVKLIELDKE